MLWDSRTKTVFRVPLDSRQVKFGAKRNTCSLRISLRTTIPGGCEAKPCVAVGSVRNIDSLLTCTCPLRTRTRSRRTSHLARTQQASRMRPKRPRVDTEPPNFVEPKEERSNFTSGNRGRIERKTHFDPRKLRDIWAMKLIFLGGERRSTKTNGAYKIVL